LLIEQSMHGKRSPPPRLPSEEDCQPLVRPYYKSSDHQALEKEMNNIWLARLPLTHAMPGLESPHTCSTPDILHSRPVPWLTADDPPKMSTKDRSSERCQSRTLPCMCSYEASRSVSFRLGAKDLASWPICDGVDILIPRIGTMWPCMRPLGTVIDSTLSGTDFKHDIVCLNRSLLVLPNFQQQISFSFGKPSYHRRVLNTIIKWLFAQLEATYPVPPVTNDSFVPSGASTFSPRTMASESLTNSTCNELKCPTRRPPPSQQTQHFQASASRAKGQLNSMTA
jgi:hypothetical protein